MFREYLEAVAQKESSTVKTVQRPSVRSTNLLEQSQYSTTLHKTFLSHHTRKEMQSLSSRAIEQQPHPSAGLMYSQFSDLQHFLLRKALPGRVIVENHQSGHVATFAGLIAELPRRWSEGLRALDWKTLVEHGIDTEKGITSFRMADAQLARAPVVVGSKPEGLAQMILRTSVSSHGKNDEMTRENPHLPWTREYVAHATDRILSQPPVKTTLLTPKKKPFTLKQANNPETQAQLMKSLFAMLPK